MKSDLPKGFPNQDFFGKLGRSTRFRLIMPGDERMTCQRSTGKVKRAATMLHKESSDYATCGVPSFYLASFISHKATAAARFRA
jgi:hypothetical protein